MRRPGRALAVLAVLGLAAACSRQQQASISQDAHDATQSARQAAADVRHDPAVKRAVADMRLIGHEAASGVRRSASQADSAVHKLAASADHATRDHKDRTSSASDNNS